MLLFVAIIAISPVCREVPQSPPPPENQELLVSPVAIMPSELKLVSPSLREMRRGEGPGWRIFPTPMLTRIWLNIPIPFSLGKH